MNKTAKQALDEAILTLGVAPRVPTGKKYTIVEFCSDYLKMPLEETVAFSREFVNDMPVVYLNENWGDNLANSIQSKAAGIGASIKQKAQQAYGVGATGNAPTVKQGWNRPLAKVSQGVGDFLNTKSSALRNSPMVKVDDNAKGVTKYIAFPDLDLARPGHKRILDAIIAKLGADGKTAQQVNIAAPERDAAQKAGNYAEIDTPDGGENKKEAVEAALQQLEDLVTSNKNQVSKYSFMSQEELADLQNQIATAAGQAAQTISAANQESQTDTNAMSQEASTAATAPANAATAQPTNGVADAHANALNNVASGADLQAQMRGGANGGANDGVASQTFTGTNVAPTQQAINPDDLAAAAKEKLNPTMPTEEPLTSQSEPVDATAAAAEGTSFDVTPGQAANFNLGGTGTQSGPQGPGKFTPGTPLQPHELGQTPIEAEDQANVDAARTASSGLNPQQAGTTSLPTNNFTGTNVTPNAPTGTVNPPITGTTPTATASFNASAGPGGLNNALTNTTRGSVEDTISANKPAGSGNPIPPVVPGDPETAPEVASGDLGADELQAPPSVDETEDDIRRRQRTAEAREFTDPSSWLSE